MESYLKNHPGVRSSIIFVLLFCIIVQLFLVGNKLGTQPLSTITPSIIQPSPTETLSILPTFTVVNSLSITCKVLHANGIELRSQPTTQFGEIIKVLPFDSQLDTLGRSSDIDWLLVRALDKIGWISSQQISGEMVVECQDELLNLPEIDSTSDLSQFIPTPAPEPTATLTLTPNVTQNPEVTPTITPTMTATLTPTATSQALMRRNNGANMNAPRRTFNVNLDGDLSEWNNVPRIFIDNVVYQPQNWQGRDDLSGFTLATWDNQFLYLAAQVTDDKIVQSNWGEQLIFGDAIELYWDGKLEEDFDSDEYNEDDSQMIFSSTSQNGFPAFWVHQAPNSGNIQIGSTFTEVGYNIEVQIPWSLLGVVPSQNAIFGYAVTIIDNDTEGTGQQETQLSTTPRAPYTHPTYWGNFILEP